MTTPESSTTSAEALLVRDITWVRTHILLCLLAVALIAGGIVGGTYVFEALLDRHDARVAAAQQKAEGVDTNTQAALLAQLEQDHTADEVRDAQQTALLTSLISKMSQQDAATKQQVATDASLDIQAAAQRLATQTKSLQGDVGIQNNLVTMSLPLTRIVVADLDELPQAQADVTNLQQQISAQKTFVADAQSELDAANKVIAADKTELVATVKADDAACVVRVNAQSAKDRKHSIWAAIGGFVGGVILGSRF